MVFEDDVKKSLKKAGITEIRLTSPPDVKMGDLSFACFELAKEKKKNPADIANELTKKLSVIGLIGKIESVGPYVNFFIDSQKLIDSTLKESLSKDFGKGKVKDKFLVEHTSINPNASPHVGRARNALLGDLLVRTLRFYGYPTEVHYFVNDVGKQIAMLASAYVRSGKKSINFDELLDLYIKINAAAISDVSIEKEVFDLLEKLEKGDKKTIKLFEHISKIAVAGQTRILSELGIKYDSFDYESQYIRSRTKMNAILKKLKKRTFKDKEGRIVLHMSGYDLPLRDPYLVLTRANGTSLYALRDIAYNLDKLKLAKNNVVILGEDQKTYHMEITAALDMLKKKAPKAIHYSFVLLHSGKMSTRQGNIVLLTDFMKEAFEKAREEILKRHPDIDPVKLAELAKKIGYGAIKYTILRVGPDKNVIFTWEEALNFEGDSAPYIQYSFVRAKKILGKIQYKKPTTITLVQPAEIELTKKIGKFPEIIKEIVTSYKVHALPKYAFELATLFNDFYEKHSVINEKDENIRDSRALLVESFAKTMKNVLELIGIPVVEFM
jgi:arginyl-tRNA synthetase